MKVSVATQDMVAHILWSIPTLYGSMCQIYCNGGDESQQIIFRSTVKESIWGEKIDTVTQAECRSDSKSVS